MKKATAVAGFVLIVIGIAALANQMPVLGIHPAVWFILGAGLLLSDTAWERLAQKKPAQDETDDENQANDGKKTRK